MGESTRGGCTGARGAQPAPRRLTGGPGDVWPGRGITHKLRPGGEKLPPFGPPQMEIAVINYRPDGRLWPAPEMRRGNLCGRFSDGNERIVAAGSSRAAMSGFSNLFGFSNCWIVCSRCWFYCWVCMMVILNARLVRVRFVDGDWWMQNGFYYRCRIIFYYDLIYMKVVCALCSLQSRSLC